MKITYISHATLLIETDGIKILTDPWIFGPAYCEQWYQFPPPLEEAKSLLHDIDYVLLTHGHEDHLHHDTLVQINKSAHIYYPYSWYDGSKEYFQSIGFKKFTEGLNDKRYQLSKNVSFTYLANNLDNIIVLEDQEKVLVNVNDSLTSAPKETIHYFLEKINTKWKNVDYLLCSYGGASYYPNTIKAGWKNDREVGTIREQFFLDNFCLIANTINARFSIPFASDFVLLDDDQQWMNEIKTPRHDIESYFNTYYKDESSRTNIKVMYPGDQAQDDVFLQRSAFHELLKQRPINELVLEIYKEQIAHKRNVSKLSHPNFITLFNKIKTHVEKKSYIIPEKKAAQLKFAIQLTDAPEEAWVEINLKEAPLDNLVKLISAPDQTHVLQLKTKSKSLDYSISKEWGGDAIIIGYGCEITIFDKKTILEELDNWAIQLLTNFPNTKEYVKRNPLRAVNYLMRDQIKRKVFLNKLTGHTSSYQFMDPILKDHELWLTRSGCDICKKCNLPFISGDSKIN
ncbi:MAG: MBL fold metallo-hydrolase [Cytophagaceae bacterium]|nr:MBL fold metallo-hydrolase [Cytophagaceae bacterium]